MINWLYCGEICLADSSMVEVKKVTEYERAGTVSELQ